MNIPVIDLVIIITYLLVDVEPRHNGGSWYGYAVYCRAANRNRYAPGYRIDSLGFRLASQAK